MQKSRLVTLMALTGVLCSAVAAAGDQQSPAGGLPGMEEVTREKMLQRESVLRQKAAAPGKELHGLKAQQRAGAIKTREMGRTNLQELQQKRAAQKRQLLRVKEESRQELQQLKKAVPGQ
jgi:hypothetical protein